MRVYGSSPLYNYVELVFRSKRLFVISIILATIVTVSVAATRATTYSARALVLLSGNASNTNFGADDPSQRGSIQYKMSVLNMVLKDPNFIKDAFREGNLDKYPNGQTMSDEDFKKFSVEAHDALQTAVGGNILELSCRWKDTHCVDIIKAFYDSFSRRVLDQETIVSTSQTQLLRSLNDEYTNKVQDLEKKTILYRQQHVGKPQAIYENAVAALQNAKDKYASYQDAIGSAQGQLQSIKEELAKTPLYTVSGITMKNYKESPEYQQAAVDKSKAETKLAELLNRYNDNAPAVRSQKELIASLQQNMDAIKNRAAGKDQEIGKHKEINQDYINLKSQEQNLTLKLKDAQKMQVYTQQAIARFKAAAMTTPEEQYRYKWLTDKQELYESIRKNLGARLEQAQMDEQKDRSMHIAEMTMMVPPEAELDAAGSKSSLFLIAGPILGIIIAFAFSLLTETLDHSLRTPLEVEKFLGKPVLAVLPRMDPPRGKAAQQISGASGGNAYLPPS